MNALDIAKYFINKSYSSVNEEEEGITNLKLQKLCYYAQGFYLAVFEKELFSEDIEAWMHGPVVPNVYQDFKSFGSNPIEINIDEVVTFDDESKELLDEVYDVFGQYTAWKLRNMTHEEPTWINHEKNAEVIPKPEMMEYFKTRIN